MSDPSPAQHALLERYLAEFPAEAAAQLDELDPTVVTDLLVKQPLAVQTQVWEHLSPANADAVLGTLGDEAAERLIPLLDPSMCARALGRIDPAIRERLLKPQQKSFGVEVERMMSYPPGSAGRLMDLRPAALRAHTSVAQARQQLSTMRWRILRKIFLIDQDGAIEAVVDIQDLALASPEEHLRSLGHPLTASVSAVDTSEQVAAVMEQSSVEELPVLDVQGRLLGVIHAQGLMKSLKDSAMADIQTMVGVSQDERAMSPVGFAVKRRILWMHINLATAFLAASVVGIFENTIAQFTALAVLLPVVAGQSGNAGAQALAVTMRGLALREISIHQWLTVVAKESRVGVLNGAAVACSTAIGVYLWSSSSGLAMIIAISMIISMTIACIAGALVPVILTRLRQDPATSSSIILTTVTDVAGFFSFLGIATVLSGWLTAS